MANYRTLNNKLISRISKAKGIKPRLKILNKIIKAYEAKMKKNSINYFKLNSSASDFNKYTLNTIKNQLTNAIKKDTFDPIKFKRRLNRLVSNSRKYQNQKQLINRELNRFENNPTTTMYKYIITSPTKNNTDSDHDPDCLADSIKSIFTHQEMLNTSQQLPRHNSCHCHFEVIKTKTKGTI